MSNDFSTMGILSAGERRDYEAGYENDVLKSYITGNQIVTPDDDGDVSALRQQFLVDNLVNTLYGSDLDLTMKRLPVVKVNSTIVEFSRMDVIGQAGDGFVPESGSDGLFGIETGQDAFSRHTRTVKFLAAMRQVGDIAKNANNIKELVSLAKQNATLELIRNANIATLWGNSGLNNLSFDGIEKQIWDYVLAAGDAEILIDMRGGTIGIEATKLAATISMERWGQPTVLIQSVGAHHATEQTVWSQLRGDLRSTDGTVASNVNEIVTQAGKIKFVQDIMLRENRPGIFSGPASVGKPATVTDDGGYPLSVDPLVTTTGAAATTAGTVDYWNYRTTNDLSAAPAATTVARASGRNNQTNNLGVGNWYYVLEAVVNGKRSAYWAFGASAANTLTGATAVTTTAIQVVKLTFKALATAMTTLPVAKNKQVYYRIYRNPTTLASAPTSLSQFGLLGTCSYALDGACVFWDNGMFIPGTTTSFLLTEKRDGRASVVWGEFMDMYFKPLAVLPLAQPFGMFMFGTPIVFFGGHHVIFHNVKPGVSL